MTDSDMEDFESADEGEELELQHKPAVKEENVKFSDVDNVNRATETLSLNTNNKQEMVQKQPVSSHEIPTVQDEASTAEQERQLRSVIDKLSSDTSSEKSSWGWGSWGASIMSTATASVSTFTNQLGEGLNTVLESVEDVLGAPPPEQLAEEKTNAEKIELTETPMVNNDSSKEKVEHGLFSTLTGVLEKTGTKVITTGLDTLELLGKKTMDVLQEGDPGLKSKRSLFQGSKSSLSEVLREAKAQADARVNLGEPPQKQTANYSILFDSYQGLIHLEALEMLSEECKDRLPALLTVLSTETQAQLKEELQLTEDLCTLDNTEDEDKNGYDFTEVLTKQASLLHPDLKVFRLKEVYEKHQAHLKIYEAQINENSPSAGKEIHSHAIEFLAEFTAVTMEFLHKFAELILLGNSTENNLSDKISSIIKIFCCEIDNAANKYSDILNQPSNEQMLASEDQEELKILTTEIFLEASNSSTYIADALHLLIPILQVSLVERQ